ncbi:hypothetical protein Tco_0887712, partial [Tanacetum coccineum]
MSSMELWLVLDLDCFFYLGNSTSESMVSSGYAESGIDHYAFSCAELAL